MKNNDKRISVLLTVMLLTFVFPSEAFAAKIISNSITAQYSVLKSIFYVSTLNEYNEAYTLAEDGDTIVVKNGSTIAFNSKAAIKKSITLKAETKGGAVLDFTELPGAKLSLEYNNITIENLKLKKDSQGGEIVNLNGSDNVVIRGNEFTGSGTNYGIFLGNKGYPLTDESFTGDNDGADNAEISGNKFDNFTNGIVVSAGNKVNVALNTFANTGKLNDEGGAVVINSDLAPSLIKEVSINNNIIDGGTLCYWSNNKLGDPGNISDPAWFDSNITFTSNTLNNGTPLTAARQLMLSLTSSSVIDNVKAGSVQNVSFKAEKVSSHINPGNVKFAVKWATTLGNLSDMVMTYDGSAVNKSDAGLYFINAAAGIDADYQLTVKLNKKGKYAVEIYAMQE